MSIAPSLSPSPFPAAIAAAMLLLSGPIEQKFFFSFLLRAVCTDVGVLCKCAHVVAKLIERVVFVVFVVLFVLCVCVCVLLDAQKMRKLCGV